MFCYVQSARSAKLFRLQCIEDVSGEHQCALHVLTLGPIIWDAPEAIRALFQFIEGWYNNQRRHSALAYASKSMTSQVSKALAEK